MVEQVERVGTDWDALAKEVTRAKVAKAPMQPVAVRFIDRRSSTPGTVEWQGQVYGSLAVVEVGEMLATAVGTETEPAQGYQLIHTPTGYFVEGHRWAKPLRMLALALGAMAVDWAAIGTDGLRDAPEAVRAEMRAVFTEWRVRYAL